MTGAIRGAGHGVGARDPRSTGVMVPGLPVAAGRGGLPGPDHARDTCRRPGAEYAGDLGRVTRVLEAVGERPGPFGARGRADSLPLGPKERRGPARPADRCAVVFDRGRYCSANELA
ncbi:hypothetical protein ADK41_33985 [Streptomyces caelestis]|uniref:Uncharacterized protein n=1 Tax=Streptomyces caelestis TaxID=36816 RepID=A0A0M8QLQ8_9ACTN|nr:hypothetical protein ADK41_33985 [Streptomyces caelestis]